MTRDEAFTIKKRVDEVTWKFFYTVVRLEIGGSFTYNTETLVMYYLWINKLPMTFDFSNR